MASSIWSMFSGATSASSRATGSGASPELPRTSPKIKGNTGPSLSLPGDRHMTDASLDVDIDDIFGPAGTSGSHVKEPPRPSAQLRPIPYADQARDPRPSPSPPKDVPEVYVRKVEEYITDHFYDVEARMKQLERKMTTMVDEVNTRETQVTEIFQMVKQLIELQFSETKKGLGRDNEMRMVSEQFERMKQEVVVNQTTSINQLRSDLDQFHHELESYGEHMMKELEDKLKKRDDATYRFEADLMAIKTSFSSLRLEFQKAKKAQDFKNTSSSVFFMKAIDMKPDERKRILRTLTEQEEKSRGAVIKAETELREHDQEMNKNGP